MTTTIPRPAGYQAAPLVGSPDALNSRPTFVESLPNGDASGGSTSPAAEEAAMPKSEPPQGDSTTGGHPRLGDHTNHAAGSDVPGSVAICLAADILDDLERVRIANENRLRQLTRTETDKDGEERGFGLDESHPDVALVAAMVDILRRVEHDATLNLQRKVRKHPLGTWAKAQRGVGEKQVARLLAAIGDPYINSAKGEPRTVSALWAYCGLHVLPVGHGHSDDPRDLAGRAQLPDGLSGLDAQMLDAAGAKHRDTDRKRADIQVDSVGVAAKRRKGERANWSTKAKMRAYLIAESCIKQLDSQCRDVHLILVNQDTHAVSACACSPYRVVYDTRRAHTAVTRPEWTDGHSHNDALRVASKAILRDLWRAAREWHSTQETS